MSRVPQKINGTIKILPYGCGRQTSGGRAVDLIRIPADNRGGQKLAKSCGRLLWMTPNDIVHCIMYIHNVVYIFVIKNCPGALQQSHPFFVSRRAVSSYIPTAVLVAKYTHKSQH